MPFYKRSAIFFLKEIYFEFNQVKQKIVIFEEG